MLTLTARLLIVVRAAQELALRHLGPELREVAGVEDRRHLLDLVGWIDVVEVQTLDGPTDGTPTTENYPSLGQPLVTPVLEVDRALLWRGRSADLRHRTTRQRLTCLSRQPRSRDTSLGAVLALGTQHPRLSLVEASGRQSPVAQSARHVPCLSSTVRTDLSLVDATLDQLDSLPRA